jgi:uncharacterized protein with von Willebrand factor type A (vWA) domain
MKTIVYSAWDGTQDLFTLARQEIIRNFIDNIMEGMSPNMALARLLWEGFPLSGMDFQVMGLKDILEQLQGQKDELFSRYSLQKAFDDPTRDIEQLLQQEARTREEEGLEPAPPFNELAPGLIEKITSLARFPFVNDESRDILESWQSRTGDILELMEFYSQWGDKFYGPEYLDFEQALELMRQFKSIVETIQQISAGQWKEIDAETLRQLLGEDAARSFMILMQVPGDLTSQGLVEFGKDGFDLSPKGIRSIGEAAFDDLYHMVKRDRSGRYQGNGVQSGEIEPDSARPYHFGDRFDLDITRTVLNAVKRKNSTVQRLRLSVDDFYVREREQFLTTTTVMLLDLSWSMSWEQRFKAAKRVALALDHYTRTKFPRDRFHVVGFSTYARELQARELALAVWDMGHAFTNLQAGIRKSMELIKRSGARNNRIIVLTDGQPTAYFRKNEELHIEFPSTMYGISPNACKATLSEVKKATAEGIHIDMFMLDNSPVLVEFVREIAKINGGRAVICVPDDLGELIFLEEIKRRKKQHL